MHIPRIYISQPLSENTLLELDKATMHHLVTVMRMKVGRQFIIFNGIPVDAQYGEFTATLRHIDKKTAQIDVGKFSICLSESPLETHLGACLIKNDRMDWLLQKATELGVTTITPLMSEYTDNKIPADRLDKKMDHWRKVLINACEQSGRVCIPDLQFPQPLQAWLSVVEADEKFVLHPYIKQSQLPVEKPRSIALLVGPEGGLSDAEVELAIEARFSGLTLGPRILRAETAPLVALSMLAYQFGDMCGDI